MLVMFVVLNLACATLELTEAPNFRPAYRLYSWQGAMLGAVLSYIAMFLAVRTHGCSHSHANSG
jgi:glucose-6-phosphate-specific signal transduction histidine kinase|eukprot:COSAG01_NODE_2000_length_8686_cov_3.000116_11_plen_64_part_00